MLETKTTLHAKLFQLYLTQVNYTSIKKKHNKISPMSEWLSSNRTQITNGEVVKKRGTFLHLVGI